MPELPNIVRERLKVSKPTSAHPSPDLLTAFAERSLSQFERGAVTEHLARCHDCRDILALALPATITSEAARTPVPLRIAWLRAPVLRWGVVAAGFAVLAVTGILQYQNRNQAESFIAAKLAKAPAPQATSGQASGAMESEKPMPGTPSTGAGSGAGFGKAAAAVPSRVPAGEADNKTGASASEQGAVATMNGLVGQSATGALINPRHTAPAPADGSTSWRMADNRVVGGPLRQSAAPSPQTAASSSLTGGVSGAAPPVSANAPDQADKAFQYEAKVQQKDQPGAAGQRSFMDATVDKAKAPAADLGPAGLVPAPPTASPLAPRWAISTTGGLLRSFDQGVTWASVDVSTSQSANMVSALAVAAQNQKYQQAAQDNRQLQAQSQPGTNQSQSQAVSKKQAASRQRPPALAVSLPVFRAVSAAGLEVWAGGTGGMLYHSADGGEQWTRVVLVASGILSTGDIVSIAFPDPLHGQITTSTQELWITLDAGQTWQKR